MAEQYWEDDYGQWPEGHEFVQDEGRFQFVSGGSARGHAGHGYGSREPTGGSQRGGYAGSDFGHGSYGASHGETIEGTPHPRPRLGGGPRGYQRSDERIREDICERLAHSNEIDPTDVTVDVHGGVVTLEGTVPERPMKHGMEDIIVQCYGVKDIDNRVRVAHREGA